MLLNATDDEGKKLDYNDIREEVDTFMFEVPKEPIGLLVGRGVVCLWGFLPRGFFSLFFFSFFSSLPRT